jgi:hypothetical protein
MRGPACASAPRARLALPVIVMLAALSFSVWASWASATHVRPKGATPKRDSLVISYKSCATPNSVHSGPLAYQSCVPQAPKSPWLTAGTPDANGLPTNFVGYTRLDVCPPPGGCSPGPPGADIEMTVAISDVRCTAAQNGNTPALCPSGPLGPFTGSVKANFPVQLTDHCNGATSPSCPAVAPPPPNSGTGPAPGPFSLPIGFNVPCAPGPPGSGSNCAMVSTFNVVIPGLVVSGTRGNFEIGRVTIDDGGPDGNAATTSSSRVRASSSPKP